jgi:hypothetical protein
VKLRLRGEERNERRAKGRTLLHSRATLDDSSLNVVIVIGSVYLRYEE